jgi:RNase P subunit RPR2
MKKISKTETEQKVKNFFENIEDKSSKDIKKIKRLAMSKNIPLKEYKKKFCKKCLSPFENSKIKIRNGKKIIECKNCKQIFQWKINS